MKYVMTFDSVYFAMKAAKILKDQGVDLRLIPTPRQISSDCSIALEVFTDNQEKTKEFLKAQNCRIAGVYEM